jgi:hypothetical protein
MARHGRAVGRRVAGPLHATALVFSGYGIVAPPGGPLETTIVLSGPLLGWLLVTVATTVGTLLVGLSAPWPTGRRPPRTPRRPD